MSGKKPDPSKAGAGGAQKDCDSCGNPNHVQKASSEVGENWEKKKSSELSGATLTSNDRSGNINQGAPLAHDGAHMNAQTNCLANVNN